MREDGKETSYTCGVRENFRQCPFKREVVAKDYGVWVNAGSTGNPEPFTSLGKKGGVHDVREREGR